MPMIKYSKKSLKAFVSPVYVIKVEKVSGDSSGMRVFLLATREFGQMSSVSFRVSGELGEREITVTDFRKSKSFGDDPVVVCELDITMVEKIVCVVEVAGESETFDLRDMELIEFDLKSLDVCDSFLVRHFANYIVFPQVDPSYWLCTCGNINERDHDHCGHCDARFVTIEDFVNKGVVAVVCEQYFKIHPIQLNLSETFDENLKKIVSLMKRETLLEQGDILGYLDIESMKNDYVRLSEERLILGAKKRKNRLFVWLRCFGGFCPCGWLCALGDRVCQLFYLQQSQRLV
jgi:hypothetical protein